MNIKLNIYQRFTLPATFTLVTSDTKWDDIVEVMTLVIVHPVSREVWLENLAFDVKPKAVTTIMADLSELTFKPLRRDKVIRYGSTVLEVLLFVVFHLLVR